MQKVIVVVFGGDPTVLSDDVKSLKAWVMQRFGKGSWLEETSPDRWDIYSPAGFAAKASRREIITVTSD